MFGQFCSFLLFLYFCVFVVDVFASMCVCIELYVLLPLWRNKTIITIIIAPEYGRNKNKRLEVEGGGTCPSAPDGSTFFGFDCFLQEVCGILNFYEEEIAPTPKSFLTEFPPPQKKWKGGERQNDKCAIAGMGVRT